MDETPKSPAEKLAAARALLAQALAAVAEEGRSAVAAKLSAADALLDGLEVVP